MTDSAAPARIPCPAGLEVAGKRLWKRVTKGYVFRADELFVLEMAAKTADVVASLEAAMVGQPLMVKGSLGQPRENPLLGEARQNRALLARLLSQLKLPDLEGDIRGDVNPARAMANQRWARRGQPAGSAGPSKWAAAHGQTTAPWDTQ